MEVEKTENAHIQFFMSIYRRIRYLSFCFAHFPSQYLFPSVLQNIWKVMNRASGTHFLNQRSSQIFCSGCSVRILQVYRIGRVSETAEFVGSLGNVRSLFHASSVRNFMGILSR